MLYNSENLSIDLKEDILVQRWNTFDLSVENFQIELKKFLEIYLKVKPNSVLWVQEKFKFNVPKDLHLWINENIVSYQLENGVKNIGFTLSKDRLTQLSVIDSLDPVNTDNIFKFYANEHDAIQDLNSKSIDYEFKLLNKKVNLEFENQLLPDFLNNLNTTKQQFLFKKLNTEKFKTLTTKEIEILILVALGYSSKEISQKVFIQLSTVLTHRKNINKKLKVKSNIEIYRYAISFGLIDF